MTDVVARIRELADKVARGAPLTEQDRDDLGLLGRAYPQDGIRGEPMSSWLRRLADELAAAQRNTPPASP